MNKKLLAVAVAGLGLLGISKSASALNYANAVLNVSVTGDLSMSIVGSAETTLAAVAPGGSSVSGSGIVLLNDSAGILETFSLKGFDSGVWLLKDAPGNSQMALQALFNSAAPASGDFSAPGDSISLTEKKAAVGIFDGNQSGAGVLPTETRTVWFKFLAPTVTNSFGDRQLTVSIVANLAD